jgi:hypothetical protein
LADIVDVGTGHGLAIVFLDEIGYIKMEILSVLMLFSVYDTICLPSADSFNTNFALNQVTSSAGTSAAPKLGLVYSILNVEYI